MSVEVAYPHITKPAGEPARLARLPRIRVAQLVMDYLAHGWSAEDMCRHYPHLQMAEVHVAMAYYFDHQEEIDQEIALEIKQANADREASRRSAFYLKLKAKGLF